MPKRIDITNKVFNQLTVIKEVGNRRGRILWECQCSCGNFISVDSDSLKRGNTKSCGCRKDAALLKRNFKHGFSQRGNKKREYIIWQHIKDRCLNVNSEFYYRYGGRGIKICDRWEDSFENFLADMGERPTPKHEIERINNDGDYTKENCKWALHSEQANNTSTNLYIEFNGNRKTLAQWAKLFSINSNTLRNRIFVSKWPLEKAFNIPVSLNNKKLNLKNHVL